MNIISNRACELDEVIRDCKFHEVSRACECDQVNRFCKLDEVNHVGSPDESGLLPVSRDKLSWFIGKLSGH